MSEEIEQDGWLRVQMKDTLEAQAPNNVENWNIQRQG